MARRQQAEAGAPRSEREGHAPAGVPEFDPLVVAQAVLDFCDLAIRCVTVRQRGQTYLAAKDASVLEDLLGKLAEHRHAFVGKLASPAKGKRRVLRPLRAKARVATLNPDQRAIGWIRYLFDKHCKEAAESSPSRERDWHLGQRLLTACSDGSGLPILRCRFGLTSEHVYAAIDAVKALAERPRSTSYAEKASDWLRGAKRSDARFSSVSAAGELLRELLERCPERDRIQAKFSGSTTADYAEKAHLQLKAEKARLVEPLERLTFLTTVLGVPLAEAPWAAYQIAKVLGGGDLLGRPLSKDFRLLLDNELRSPTAYRRMDEEERRALLATLKQHLLEAGLPETDLINQQNRELWTSQGWPIQDEFTNSYLWYLLDGLAPAPTPWAGTEVGPTSPMPSNSGGRKKPRRRPKAGRRH